jgi:hypothetical protein
LAAPAVRLSNASFFLTRAEQARVEADQASLNNVRERCRRSEAAWMVLADRAQRAERVRLQEQEIRAARPPT